MDTIAYIPLTQGKEAIIDRDMFYHISNYKWHHFMAKNANTGYATSWEYSDGKTKSISMHRHIWEKVHGPIPDGMSIDHINGDGLDNRLKNLRLADKRLQAVNSVHRRSGLTQSKYPGVYRENNGKWAARITINRTSYRLGRFIDELEAHYAYLTAVKAYNDTGELPKRRTTTSQYPGVYWHKNRQKWVSGITIQHKKYHLGCFDTELEAFNAYQSALDAHKTNGVLPEQTRHYITDITGYI